MNRRLFTALCALTLFLAAQGYAHVEEFEWHGESVHLETPSPLKTSQEGSLVSFVSSDCTGRYTLWTTTDPIDDLTIDQVIDTATSMIQKNGGIVTKVTKGLMDGREIVDIEGGNPAQGIWFFKGRIVLTPKNAFYLETMYKNSTERHAYFVSKFKVDSNRI
jgi:hypothetical protein